MIVAHIDSALLAAPNNFANDAEEAIEIFQRIIEWAAWSRCGALLPVVASDLAERLGELECYPAYPFIQKAIADFGLEHVFRAQDLQIMVQGILAHALPQIEALGFEIEAADAITCDPDILEGRYPIALRELSLRSFLNSAAAAESSELRSANVVASGSPAISAASAEVSAGNLTILGNAALVPVQDGTCTGKANVVARIENASSLFTAVHMWDTSETATSLHFAIASRALEISEANGVKISFSDLSPFRIGSEFLKSTTQYQAGPGGNWGSVTLDTCARVLLNDATLPVQPFSDVRPSDNAECFRVQVTTGNPALRLFLWKVNETWEFANIDAKKNLKPERGDCDAYLTIKYPKPSLI